MKDNKDFKDLKAMAGAYKPGFMQIKLTHQFQKGFGDFTIEQLGVFFHEYFIIYRTYLLLGDCI